LKTGVQDPSHGKKFQSESFEFRAIVTADRSYGIFVPLVPQPQDKISNKTKCLPFLFQKENPRIRRPSSLGVALMKYDTAADQEATMELQLVHHCGDVVKLQQVEDTNDRFIRELARLTHVVVWNFPEEH
jgi:hypothetical protein